MSTTRALIKLSCTVSVPLNFQPLSQASKAALHQCQKFRNCGRPENVQIYKPKGSFAHLLCLALRELTSNFLHNINLTLTYPTVTILEMTKLDIKDAHALATHSLGKYNCKELVLSRTVYFMADHGVGSFVSTGYSMNSPHPLGSLDLIDCRYSDISSYAFCCSRLHCTL